MKILNALILLIMFPNLILADTMEHFINITNTIPQMEMKADPQSQAWARSARHVLILTNESIAETLIHANNIAKNQGQALFCLPTNKQLDATTMNDLILQAYKDIPNLDKNKMSISEIAWLAVTKNYPCAK